jgi:hypothetical protein
LHHGNCSVAVAFVVDACEAAFAVAAATTVAGVAFSALATMLSAARPAAARSLLVLEAAGAAWGLVGATLRVDLPVQSQTGTVHPLAHK